MVPSFRLQRSRFGVSDLSLDGNRLLFADYSSSGNDICFSAISEAKNSTELRDNPGSYLINRFKLATKKTEAGPNNIYNPVPYHRMGHLFRFHSWMPFYADLDKVESDPASITPGVTLMTQNDLSTLISTFGYEYSGNQNKLHASVQWLGWYPVLESRIDYGNTPVVEKFNQSVANPAVVNKGYQFTNTLLLPLFFSGGRFSKYLYISASSTLENNYLYNQEKDYYNSHQNELTGRIYFSNYRNSALRDIYPKWAQTIDMLYSYYPFDKVFYGDILTVKSSFYFPGLFRNNGLKLRFEAEKQNPEKYVLANRADFPRSYDNIISKDLRFLSADYFLPVAYPDFNLASLLYITRIRTDFFYDFSRATGNYIIDESDGGSTLDYHDYTENFRSFGIELMSDFYVLRLPFLISGGIQAAWRNPGEIPYLKALFNINVFGMSIGGKRR